MSPASQLLQKATDHHQAGRLTEAEKAYGKLLLIDAANIDGLRLLGGLYLQTGRFEQAVDLLEKAVLPSHKDPETLTNLAIALKSIGRFDDALERLKEALDVQRDYVPGLTNQGALYLMLGRVADALKAYGDALRLEPESPGAHFNYANALCAAGQATTAILRYEYALKLKPDYYDAMINLGLVLGQIGRSEQSQPWLLSAQGWFEKVLHSDPENVVAHNNIGNVLRQQGKPEEAVAHFRKALKIKPTYANAAINMATSLRDLGLWEEAIESCKHALRLAPTSAEVHINLGSFFQELARHQEALTHIDEALRYKPLSLDAKWNKAISLLALGRYPEGWEMYEVGLGVAHMRGEYPSPEKRWHGQEFKGKRLLLWCEQGFGDSLQFVRYAELCKQRGGEIIMLCPPSLRNLFRNCSFIDRLPKSVEEGDYDFHVPLMSLPFVFSTDLDSVPHNIPYLFISEDAKARWAKKVEASTLYKVGLVWAGNPREHQLNAHLIDRRRSMDLQMLRPLFDNKNIQFYNLQMGQNAAQIDTCGLRSRFIDLVADIKDFEDTGALIEHLDLVISVDTSVVHLAGGLGKPVWVMSRFDACWRWLQNQPHSPWYPSARIFGQTTRGEWEGVVQAIKDQLSVASMTTKA